MITRFNVDRRCLIVLAIVGFSLAGCEDDNCVQHDCFTADAEVRSVYIRDYNYARHRFLDLGLVRDPAIGDTLRFLLPTDEIIRFDLFESGETVDQPGWAYEYWPDTARADIAEYNVSANFRRVDLTTQFNYSVNEEGWYFYFPQRPSGIDSRTYAYYLEYRRNGVTETIGDISGAQLRLQLLFHQNAGPNDPLWDAEWKNVYDLGTRGIDYDTFEFTLYKGAIGTETAGINPDNQEGIPYLQLLGLDVADQSGLIGQPDNMIDNNSAILDLASGLLIFPDRRPFDTDVGYAVLHPSAVLDPRVPYIYDSANETARRNASVYYMELAVRFRPTEIALGHVHLIPESEVVTFHGRRLVRGIDYSMDYESGSIQFLRDDVLDPNSDLTICYEYAP